MGCNGTVQFKICHESEFHHYARFWIGSLVASLRGSPQVRVLITFTIPSQVYNFMFDAFYFFYVQAGRDGEEVITHIYYIYRAYKRRGIIPFIEPRL